MDNLLMPFFSFKYSFQIFEKVNGIKNVKLKSGTIMVGSPCVGICDALARLNVL